MRRIYVLEVTRTGQRACMLNARIGLPDALHRAGLNVQREQCAALLHRIIIEILKQEINQTNSSIIGKTRSNTIRRILRIALEVRQRNQLLKKAITAQVSDTIIRRLNKSRWWSWRRRAELAGKVRQIEHVTKQVPGIAGDLRIRLNNVTIDQHETKPPVSKRLNPDHGGRAHVDARHIDKAVTLDDLTRLLNRLNQALCHNP